MKVGIVYWTMNGNTEALANKAKDVAEANGATVYFSAIENIDKGEFFGCDAFAIGSPAQGQEELAPDIQDLMDGVGDELKGKKVIIFGSYGWGGGAFMDAWKDQVAAKGAVLAHDPVTCLEAPDDDAFSNMEAATKALLG